MEHIFEERRRSERIPVNFKARISGSNKHRAATILNMSRHGALIDTDSDFNVGDPIDLKPSLPKLDKFQIKAKIVRAVAVCSSWGFYRMQLGVEFIRTSENQLANIDRTINFFSSK